MWKKQISFSKTVNNKSRCNPDPSPNQNHFKSDCLLNWTTGSDCSFMPCCPVWGDLILFDRRPNLVDFIPFSLQKTCCTRPLRRRRGGTRRSAWSRVPTLTSWMWNVQVRRLCRSRRGVNPLCTDGVSISSIGCYKITTVFSHAQTVVLCVGCSTVLCQPTGGKARLTEGEWLAAEVGSAVEAWRAALKVCRHAAPPSDRATSVVVLRSHSGARSTSVCRRVGSNRGPLLSKVEHRCTGAA